MTCPEILLRTELSFHIIIVSMFEISANLMLIWRNNFTCRTQSSHVKITTLPSQPLKPPIVSKTVSPFHIVVAFLFQFGLSDGLKVEIWHFCQSPTSPYPTPPHQVRLSPPSHNDQTFPCQAIAPAHRIFSYSLSPFKPSKFSQLCRPITITMTTNHIY